MPENYSNWEDLENAKKDEDGEDMSEEYIEEVKAGVPIVKVHEKKAGGNKRADNPNRPTSIKKMIKDKKIVINEEFLNQDAGKKDVKNNRK
jgi:hypothetical protein